MGFRLGRTFFLEFPEGHYLYGSEIRLRSASIATLESIEENKFSDSIPALLDHLVSWNLETSAGTPLKPVLEDVRAEVERPVIRAIITAWYEATTGVTAPLGPKSSDGQPSLEAGSMELSLPMEVS